MKRQVRESRRISFLLRSRIPVTVGPLTGDLWLIADGLQDGERIVLDGGLKLAPGVPVKPIEPGEAAAGDAAAAGQPAATKG